MPLSFPIPVLKSQAKRIRRAEDIPLSQALDRVAAREGYASWSLLAARNAGPAPRREPGPAAGEMLLIAGRPGEGKTRYAIRLLIDALRAERPGWYFALHNQRSGLREQFAHFGADLERFAALLARVESDDVHAGRVDRLVRGTARPGSVVVIDYLQALDRRRSHPALDEQLATLGQLARETGAAIVFTGQISRAFDAGGRSEADVPGPDDLRRLNPIDLGVFDRMIFLHGGAERVHRRAR